MAGATSAWTSVQLQNLAKETEQDPEKQREAYMDDTMDVKSRKCSRERVYL